MRRHSDKYGIGVLSELNITPLLDLAFVLLIIFMIAAPLLSVSDGAAASIGNFTEAVPERVTKVKIALDKSLEINGQAVEWKDLLDKLDALKLDSPNSGVLVESHRTLPVHDLVQLMGAIRSAGFKEVGVVTEVPSS
jgi:biopolymer transport protein ExbD